MDAMRLIRTTRHALSEARSATDVLAEAWQVCTLAEAVGAHVAAHGEDYVRPAAQALAEAAGHAGGCLERPSDDWTGSGRAARLTGIEDRRVVLRELRELIHALAETLVVVACGAGSEELYWRCIDGVDATTECKDRVSDLMQALGQEGAAIEEELPAEADLCAEGPVREECGAGPRAG